MEKIFEECKKYWPQREVMGIREVIVQQSRDGKGFSWNTIENGWYKRIEYVNCLIRTRLGNEMFFIAEKFWE